MTQACNIQEYEAPAEGTAVALGFFDGVHVGHRELLRHNVEKARALGLRPVVFTFGNHPATCVRPCSAPAMLTSLTERLALLNQLGLQCVTAPFDRACSLSSPTEFVRSVLIEKLNIKHATVGPNYSFGHNAAGSSATLRQLGRELGFTVDCVSPVQLEHSVVSSSLIRRLVSLGEVGRVAQLLARPYSFANTVIHGRAYGRTVGIPTANLLVPSGRATPGRGVYAVWAGVGSHLWPGLAYYGSRPTFDGEGQLLEVNLAAYTCREPGAPGAGEGFEVQWGESLHLPQVIGQEHLYGQTLQVFFLAKLRAEQRFATPKALLEQILRDREGAVQALSRTNWTIAHELSRLFSSSFLRQKLLNL